MERIEINGLGCIHVEARLCLASTIRKTKASDRISARTRAIFRSTDIGFSQGGFWMESVADDKWRVIIPAEKFHGISWLISPWAHILLTSWCIHVVQRTALINSCSSRKIFLSPFYSLVC